MSTFVLAIFVFLAMSCSKPTPVPVPVPPPVPVTEFSVQGTNVSVQGKLKPGAKITADHAKSVMQLGTSVLEKK